MHKGSKILNIPTDESKIYRQVIKLLNFDMDLTKKELNVLAEFVRLNTEYIALDADKRAKFIFSTDIRKDVMAKLDLDDNSLNNILSRLRRATFMGKPVLTKDNIILQDLLFFPSEQGFTLQFNLVK